MHIDIQTLALVLGLTNLLQAIVLLVQYRVSKAHRGPGWWALSSAALALAFAFNFLRGDSTFALGAMAASTLGTYGFIALVNRRLNAQYREARATSELIFNTSPDAVLITRMGDGQFVDANDGFTALSGYARAEVLGRTTLEVDIWKDPADRQRLVAALQEKGSCENVEAMFQRKDGSQFLGMLSARLLTFNGGPHLVTVTRDITERRRDERRVQELAAQLEIERDFAQHSALTDGLTRLANRRHFDDLLNTEFYRMKRSGAPLSLIMLDVDHFKKFNDHYGHLAGDDCLRRVGQVMKAVAGRGSDLPARYGGEEFAVILPETDAIGARTMADRIRHAIEELAIPHEANPEGRHVTVSLGLVTGAASELASPDRLIELADEAMYRAKQAGRNRVEVAPSGTREGARIPGLLRLVWREAMETGNSTIDAQHRALFERSNALLSAVLEDHPKEVCRPLMEKLLAEILNHFRDEENLIRAAGFPLAGQHAECHAALVAKAMGLAERYDRDELPLGELFGFLAYDVVAQHMLMEDRKFFPYLESVG